MKTRLLISLSFTIVFFSVSYAQKSIEPLKATLIQQAIYLGEVPSIADQIENGTFQPAVDFNREVNPKRRDGNVSVPGKGLPKYGDPLIGNQTKAARHPGKDPILTFEAASSGVTPTDPTGAVGPDHFVNAWNSSFRIWDKEGNPLTSPASLGTIWPGQTLGDPIVFYDNFEDRFVITQFYSNGFLIAVSQGPDPVNSGWYTYQFGTNTFPDYPKFSVWSDGYYITANKNSSSAGFSEVVYALERDKLLVGDPTALMVGFPLPTITTSGFFSPLGFNAIGTELPPPGDAPIVYLQDDIWSGVSTDHLKVWLINVDWETPNNSTISDPEILETEPFDGWFDGGSFSNLPQPSGPDIDALQATIMYMAQYRRFPDYNAVVLNHVVDLDGGDDYAGIRWYELRQENDGDAWDIYQQGTYIQPEGHSAFCGAICMDANGNIGMSYSIVSQSKYPSLGFTGRFASDDPGTMTIEEEIFATGTQSDPSFRYGDYSQMTIDPNDDQTFWAIGEYFTGGTRKNQVGVFKVASDLANDVGIVSIDEPVNGVFFEDQEVTVTVRNYGTAEQSNIPVSYQIDEGPVVEEVFAGPIGPNTNIQYTFATLGDFSIPGQVYTVFASSNLVEDQNLENDTVSGQVKHLFIDDIGVSAILAPVSGAELSDEEPITVMVENYGLNQQFDFDISFTLNGGTAVTEQVEGPIPSEGSLEFTFDATGDFSAVMDHELFVTTYHPEDWEPANDSITAIISNTLCQPVTDCSQGVGIYALQLGGIDNVSGCDPNGYGNYSNLSTTLLQGSSNDLTISTEYGSVFVKVWIDFNDNFNFEPEEVVVNDYEIAEGQAAGNYTETMPLDIAEDAGLGEHLMRVKTNYNESVPDDPCEETMFGETEDYKVVVDESTGTGVQSLETNDLVVYNQGNNQFNMRFQAKQLTETLIVSVHNLQGQKLIRNRVENINGLYEFEFDMSYARKGMYLIKLGSESFGKIQKFIVE